MFKRSFITFIIILLTSSLAFAVDDQGNPNDPTINPRANACYEDGSMADKCDTPWEWECGWHLIQFEEGLTTRGEFPSWCLSIIPPEILPEPLIVVVVTPAPAPVPAPSTPSAGCVEWATGRSIDFAGGFAAPAGTLQFVGSSCTGRSAALVGNYVYAPAPFDALALCNSFGTFTSTTSNLNDVYRCL